MTGANCDLMFQFKISLLGSSPKIWRRILIADCPLVELHRYINEAFGWWNYHLHVFEINGQNYSQPVFPDWHPDYAEPPFTDGTYVLISDLLPLTKFKYNYDFGDCWELEVVLESQQQRYLNADVPICIGGKWNAPPEDVGGVYGFKEYIAIMADPNHPEH